MADLIRLGVRDELSNQFMMPAVFWSPVAQEASGFFGCQDTRDDNGELRNFGKQSLFWWIYRY